MTAMFIKGLKVNHPDYQLFPNEASSGTYFFQAFLLSPTLIAGPIAWIGLEINQYLTDPEASHSKLEIVLSAPTNMPITFIFGLLLAILFFIGFPIWGVELWKMYFFRRKMRQLEKEGIYQYGVYLDETKLLVRVYNRDDELVEHYIERSSIRSVNEMVSTFFHPKQHVGIVTRRLLITWTENQKSWYIDVDCASFTQDDFIALGLALNVVPSEEKSVFKD